MLAFFAEVKSWIGLLAHLWVWLAIGGAIGFLGGLFKPWLGYPGVAVGGAAIMFAAVFFNWAADDSGKVARLEEANRQLEAKQLELRLTTEALRQHLKAQSEAHQHNEEVYQRLRDKVNAMPDNPDCEIGEDVLNELRAIR